MEYSKDSDLYNFKHCVYYQAEKILKNIDRLFLYNGRQSKFSLNDDISLLYKGKTDFKQIRDVLPFLNREKRTLYAKIITDVVATFVREKRTEKLVLKADEIISSYAGDEKDKEIFKIFFFENYEIIEDVLKKNGYSIENLEIQENVISLNIRKN